MKVLVTGGTGFIGSYVCDVLLGRGCEPLVFDRQAGRPRYAGAANVILGDVRDPVAVTEAVAHADAVIHLAGVLGTQETVGNPRPAAETNVLGSLNVFEAVAQYQLPAVYICVGNWWEQNSYSITKTCAERFAVMFNRERGTRISAVRAMNAYGPRQVPAAPFGPSKVRKIMPAFICRALTGQPLEVYGDGEQVMDMVHAADVAGALVEELFSPSGLDTPRVVGTGARTTVNDIAEMVCRAAGQGEIVHVPLRPGESPGAEVLAPERRYDFVQLQAGTFETVEWFRERWLPTWRS